MKREQYISFDYYSPKQKTNRMIEPYLLVFRWNTWFLWGYCKLRQDFRMFRVARIQNLMILDETFTPRQVKEPEDISINLDESKRISTYVAFEPETKWRLMEELGPEQMKVGEDGRVYVNLSWSDKNTLLVYLLGYGKDIEVIGPQNLRDEYIQLVKDIVNKY